MAEEAAGTEETAESVSDFDLSEFDKPYHFGGFFRQGISGLKPYYPYDKGYTDMTSESRIRLRAEYARGPLEAEISGNADYLFTNHPESPAFLPLYASEVRNRALSLETIQNKKDYLIRADIHRMSVA
ncbi:MAG: hypothetical protein KDK23_04205, partial [Leptospiraceae bacterium]|nr:hypothetical protein [Leptospiraceae bacterium]